MAMGPASPRDERGPTATPQEVAFKKDPATEGPNTSASIFKTSTKVETEDLLMLLRGFYRKLEQTCI